MIFIIIIIIIEWGFHISQAIQEPPTLTVLRDLQPALLRGHSRLVTAQLLLAASPPCKGFAKAPLGPPNHSAETIVYSMTFVQLLILFYFFFGLRIIFFTSVIKCAVSLTSLDLLLQPAVETTIDLLYSIYGLVGSISLKV